MRTRGGINAHPSPMESLYRLRMIILGHNPGFVQKNLNVEDVTKKESLVANLLRTSYILITKNNIHRPAQENFEVESTSASTATNIDEEGNMHLIHKCESDSIMYLAGWLACKFKAQYTELCKRTYKTLSEHNYDTPTGVQKLSFGGLTKPSANWVVK